MNQSPIHVGIDTSKDQLDIGILPSHDFFSVPNDPQGIESAIEQLLKVNPNRVLIEATGRLELPFSIAAYKAGLPIVICNAAHVHYFAKSTGQLAKTDKLDAFTIAKFGQAHQPELTAHHSVSVTHFENSAKESITKNAKGNPSTTSAGA